LLQSSLSPIGVPQYCSPRFDDGPRAGSEYPIRHRPRGEEKELYACLAQRPKRRPKSAWNDSGVRSAIEPIVYRRVSNKDVPRTLTELKSLHRTRPDFIVIGVFPCLSGDRRCWMVETV
jgi:hypothetical protein